MGRPKDLLTIPVFPLPWNYRNTLRCGRKQDWLELGGGVAASIRQLLRDCILRRFVQTRSLKGQR
jgi:hypothetical protein